MVIVLMVAMGELTFYTASCIWTVLLNKRLFPITPFSNAPLVFVDTVDSPDSAALADLTFEAQVSIELPAHGTIVASDSGGSWTLFPRSVIS